MEELILHPLSFYKKDLFKLFRTLLVNSDTREAAKTYLQEVIGRNVKRTQMQPDEKQVAGK